MKTNARKWTFVHLLLNLFILIFSHAGFAQDYSKGIFSLSKSENSNQNKGSFSYQSKDQSYTFKGRNQTVFDKIKGDFIATANFEMIKKDKNQQEFGWFISSDVPNSNYHILATQSETGFTQLKLKTNHEEIALNPTKRNYTVLELERQGNEIILRGAHQYEPMEELARYALNALPESINLGIFYDSDSPINEGLAWNIRVDQPKNQAASPYFDHDWMGCRMEIMDIATGKRKVIYTKESTFEAPNWMPKGDQLLFNMDGSLYKIPIEGGEISKLNTGFADRLNNDHCISFDGKMLGISHSNKGEGSKVYYLPLEGGEPTLFTRESPSYLHGWSPDGKNLVYIANRPGSSSYDIYKKALAGGEEINLTKNEEYSHADGSEYSPDGKYIYYNGSVRGGTMQIWRMMADGSEKEQLTFDANNNWFPHISPDGKWMVYISFDKNIDLNSHPSFKRVSLKMMPAQGGASKTIAYLYGGQGTINVNSWSPDGKYIAFVSNSK